MNKPAFPLAEIGAMVEATKSANAALKVYMEASGQRAPAEGYFVAHARRAVWERVTGLLRTLATKQDA